MLTKLTLITATAAIALSGAAVAGEAKGPMIMNDKDMDSVVAGDDPIYPTNPGGVSVFVGLGNCGTAYCPLRNEAVALPYTVAVIVDYTLTPNYYSPGRGWTNYPSPYVPGGL